MPILGIDEVGRGPWAGPLVIGAVILKQPETQIDFALAAEDVLSDTTAPLLPIWDDLADSKKLTKLRREELNQKIEDYAYATGLGWVSADELDELGLPASLRLAARRAVAACLKKAGLKDAERYVAGNHNISFPPNFPVDEIIIDGTVNFLRGTPLESRVSVLKKADSLIKEVSAASIVAKVARDNYMVELSKKYPGYGFENHVGYGTAEHKKALELYGPCPEHRASFRPIAKLIGEETKAPSSSKNATTSGQAGEEKVAEYLRKRGHKILARNYKTRFYEIDIISATEEHLYFTEVKYRQSDAHGSPFEAITKRKKEQMSFAAECFMEYLAKRLKRNPESLPSPVLAAAAVSGQDFLVEDWLVIS
ncbi:ribonuclease HII [Candidatus Saccharibacteria bacterium]|nr:ribonuclease HII [Candidatus Saccharibacteria bacterium]